MCPPANRLFFNGASRQSQAQQTAAFINNHILCSSTFQFNATTAKVIVGRYCLEFNLKNQCVSYYFIDAGDSLFTAKPGSLSYNKARHLRCQPYKDIQVYARCGLGLGSINRFRATDLCQILIYYAIFEIASKLLLSIHDVKQLLNFPH